MCCGSKVLRKKGLFAEGGQKWKDDVKSQLERKSILCNPFKRTPTEFSIRSKCSSRRINLFKIDESKTLQLGLESCFCYFESFNGFSSKSSRKYLRKSGEIYARNFDLSTLSKVLSAHPPRTQELGLYFIEATVHCYSVEKLLNFK